VLADGGHEVHPLVWHVFGTQRVQQVEAYALGGIAVDMGNFCHFITFINV
tara:strand:+ start:1759 stop:1908 length:150 start_codon:yes stop_codon:yes gene_type:complete